MITIDYKGRLGNNIIQYIVANFLSHKYNLKLDINPPINDDIEFIKNENGNIGEDLIIVNDDNFIDIFNGNIYTSKPKFHLDGFFRKYFLDIYEDEIKKNIKIKYDENINKNDLFIHYRIGDIIDDRRMLPLEYYLEAISNMNFENGYISSDTINHKFCDILINDYNFIPLNLNERETINFGKNFKNLILSEGTFSFLIGYFSNTNNVFCNEREELWCGELNLKRWKKLYWDYDKEYIYDRIYLKEYKPINIKK